MWRVLFFSFLYLWCCVPKAAYGTGLADLTSTDRIWPRPRLGECGEEGSASAVELSLRFFTCDVACADDGDRSTVIEACERLVRSPSFSLKPGTLPYLRPRLPPLRNTSVFGGSIDREFFNGDSPLSSLPLALPELASLRVEILHHQQQPPPEENDHYREFRIPFFGMNEKYELEISSSTDAVLRAESMWGALRGLETFAQLIRWTGRRYVIEDLPIRIHDAPQYPWRGLLLDTARHYFSLESIFRILDAMSALRMNVFHWHIVDSQSFPFRSERFPDLAAHGALHPDLTYGHEDIKEVVKFAAKRGIRVVPELDMPGHAASWRLRDDETPITTVCEQSVSAAAREEGPSFEWAMDRVALNPFVNKTFEIVEGLLQEFDALFPDTFWHLGGDELNADCVHEGGGEAVRRFHFEFGFGWLESFQQRFTERAVASLPRRRKAILWDDALAMDLLPREVELIQLWRGWEASSSLRKLRALGKGVIMSKDFYLDHLHVTWEDMYRADMSRAGSLVVGGEACSWSEHADETNVDSRIFLRLSAVAEVLWSGSGDPLPLARSRLAIFRCFLVRRGVAVSPVLSDHCDHNNNYN